MGLLSAEPVTVGSDPFWFGYWDGVEVPDYFPDPSLFVRLGEEGNEKYNKFTLKHKHNAFKDALGPWKPFMDEVRSAEFQRWCVERFSLPPVKERTQIEFSILPADGGYIWEHTDTPTKIITFVLYCGGWPADLECKGADGWTRIPWKVGRMCFFVKNEHSWHRVGKLEGPAGEWRKTITVNLHRLSGSVASVF